MQLGRTTAALVQVARRGKGANLNHQDKDSWTPLIIACGHGSADVTKLLLAAGADTGLKDEEGMTAMDKARTHNKTECIALLDEWQGLSPAGCEAKVAQWWPELLAQKKRQELQQRAFRLGILQPLRDAGLESDETVAAAVRWCDDNVASNISELLKTGMVGELVAALKLKGIPAKKLEAAIQPPRAWRGCSRTGVATMMLFLGVSSTQCENSQFCRTLRRDCVTLPGRLGQSHAGRITSPHSAQCAECGDVICVA